MVRRDLGCAALPLGTVTEFKSPGFGWGFLAPWPPGGVTA